MAAKTTDFLTPEQVAQYREYHRRRRQKLPQDASTKEANSAFARAARKAKKFNQETGDRHGS